MSFTQPWINAYNSLLDLQQDPITGMLRGTYSSTTGGSGTYNVIGWASLQNATPAAGQTMAISILWRSNDGGISDPSHEVSAMAGQVVAINPQKNLVLMHIFVETNPDTVPKTGIYPDKLIFTPTAKASSLTKNNLGTTAHKNPRNKDNLSGIWSGKISGKLMKISIQLADPRATRLLGEVTYPDGSTYPIAGFTDIYASPPAYNWQGISFSTYIEGPDGRECIAMAGYLDLTTNVINLTRLSAQSTGADSTWYQVQIEQLQLEKNRQS